MAPLLLFALALALRAIDIFALRLDELWGEILLSKSLGFALVVGYVWLAGRSLGAIGLHGRRVGAACGIGGLVAALALAGAYGVVLATGDATGLAIGAVDPKTGMQGGALFATWLVGGNVVNALMEEGLFRGAPTDLPLFGPVYLLLSLLLVPWAAILATRMRLPETRPW